MRTLRFVRPGNVRPNVESLSELLSKPDLWKQVEVWEGRLAPGGSLCVARSLPPPLLRHARELTHRVCSEDRLHRLAKIWAKIHRESSKVPKFALLALSGFIMNFVVSWVRCPSLTLARSRTRRLTLSARQFHKDDDKKQARFMEQVEKAREDQAAATWAACVSSSSAPPHGPPKLTICRRRSAKETTTAPAPASAPAASTTPAKKRASKRK